MHFLALLQRTVEYAEPVLGFWGQLWAYVTLGVTSIITEEAAPLLGGVAAQQGELGLKRVAIAIALGTWAAHIGLYYLGRWRGKWIRARWPKVGRYLTRALRYVRRYPWRSSIAVRYAYGLRLTLPMACGAAHVPIFTFVIGSGISSITWASLFTVLGWAFGRTAMQVLRHVKRFEDVILLAGVGVVGVLLLALTRRSQTAVASETLPDPALTPSQPLPAFDGGTPPDGIPAMHGEERGDWREGERRGPERRQPDRRHEERRHGDRRHGERRRSTDGT
jgi:membrane protein DedA with SNARE-associated domain